jgi:hypothetical protein
VTERREKSGADTGCLIALVGGVLGFAAWLYAPPQGYRYVFEGEKNERAFLLDLPLVTFGVPLIALLVWAPVHRRSAGRVAWPVAAAALAALAWGAWWFMATRPNSPPGLPGPGS